MYHNGYVETLPVQLPEVTDKIKDYFDKNGYDFDSNNEDEYDEDDDWDDDEDDDWDDDEDW